MCFGSGGSNDALDQENARRARTQETINQINTLFPGGDQPRFDEVKQNTIDFFTPKLDIQREQGNRDIKFELARRGTIGGSAQIDAQDELQRREDDAREKIGVQGISASDRAKTLDETLRNTLIGQANAGADRESLLQTAGLRQLENTSRASNEAQQNTIGDVFSNASLLFRDIDVGRNFQAGRSNSQEFFRNNNPFLSNTGKSFSGRIVN